MKMNESPLMDRFGHLASHRLDIQDLIDRTRNFIFIAQPLFISAKVIQNIFRWENQTTTILTLVMLNFFGIFITKSGLFMIFLLTFTTVIVLGFFHRQYKIFIKVIPSIDPDASYNCKSHSENMRDFRLLLSVVENSVTCMSDGLLKAYSILTWDDLRFSTKYHIILASSILLLLFLPLRYFILFALDLSFILSRPTYCHVDDDGHDSSYLPSSANETPESESLPVFSGSTIATATTTATTNTTVTSTNASTTTTAMVLNNFDKSELTSETSDQVDVCYATDSDCSERLADDLNSDEDSTLHDVADTTNNKNQQQKQQNVLPQQQQIKQQQQLTKPSIMDGVTYKQLHESQETDGSPQISSSLFATTTTTQSSTTSTMLTASSTSAATSGNKTLLNQKVPNLVDKFMELKNKAKNMPMEKCKNCGAIFTAILKRRHVCNCCGNHYCSRCCSHKVPRSRFGATAPAAQTETVAVCTGCLHKLIEQRKEKVT